jgi:hypothetical protein
MYLAYTGVGSRRTPPEVLGQMYSCGRALAAAGYTLRSGGAAGADHAFEQGAREVPGARLEISLPWKGYNDNPSVLYVVEPRAVRLAATLHPAWERVSIAGRRLHGRNCYQVLGRNLNWPSDFLACWTPDGFDSLHAPSDRTGGTRTAIALAIRHHIPVFNLARPERLAALRIFLSQRGIPIFTDDANESRQFLLSSTV